MTLSTAESGSERDLFERNHALKETLWDITMLNDVARNIHRLNQHFYCDIHTGLPMTGVNPAEKIALMHSELSEMLEGVRKGLKDDHLPHRSAEEVEAADLLIRLLDYIGWRGLDLQGAMREKLKYNVQREDHTNEARRADGGKKF